MKNKFVGALILLSGIALLYTSCKKDAAKQNTTQSQTTAATPDVISNLVAANLSQSLAGAYGGVNVGDGLNAPSLVSNSGHHHGFPGSLCGFTADSVLNYDTTAGDTVSHTTGRLIFYFNCLNGQPDGYFANDSLHTTGTTPGYSFMYDVTQYYVITSLNPDNTQLFVDGALKSFVDITYNQQGVKPTSAHTTYVLTKLKVDLTNKHNTINSGTATFVSTGSNNYGSWSFTGTIKYLGNHKADVTINGVVYHLTI